MTLYMLLSDSYSLEKLQAVFNTDDSLLLLGDGAYQLPLLASFNKIYVRSKDLQQRGLSADNYRNARCINDEQWLELTLKHRPIVSLK